MTGLVNPLFFIGVVEDREDPRLEGRVKVRAFDFHGTKDQIDTQDLPWATLVIGSHSPNFSPPPLNAWVLGMFMDGRDAQQPLVFGLLPTQMATLIDPANQGYGAIAKEYHSLNSLGHRPEDYGQPMISPSARGEYRESDVFMSQEMSRVMDAKIAGSDETWSEAGSAYAPQYPYNQVFDTASGHTIHLDDTPSAERVLVYHRSGSFIQMDANGNTIIKSSSDSTNITEGNSHTYVGSNGGGAQNIVTIMGDSRVYIDGDKIEEVRGNVQQIVHGNYILDVAGETRLNTSDRIEMRAARLQFEANVGNISLSAKKSLSLGSGAEVSLKSANFSVDLTGKHSVKASQSVLVASGGVSVFGGTLSLAAASKASLSGATLALGASGTYHENWASKKTSTGPVTTGPDAPDAPSTDTTSVTDIPVSDLPEPTQKSISTSSVARRVSYGSVSYGSKDSVDENVQNASYGSFTATPVNNPSSVRELYDFMIELGLSHEQAVGALVNIKRESTFNAGAVGDNGHSFGLFQFNLPSGRAAPFLQAVPNWQNDPKGQLRFMFTQDPQGKSYAKRQFSSALEAANWFTNRVEIPQNRASYTGPNGYNEVNIGSIMNIVGETSA